MAKNNVIIRKLVAVESLGSCTYICSDKTGTLTVNQLTIREIVLPDGKNVQVSGEGVSPGGNISGDLDSEVQQLCITGLLANESHLDYSGGDWTADGDIVDVAFLVLAKKIGLSITQHRNEHGQLDLIPYESEKAYSGSMNQHDNQSAVIHVKGSPEKIISMCSHMAHAGSISPIDKKQINQQFETLADQGYRVIALARRMDSDSNMPAENQLADMIFLGLVAMIDPVRPEACDAVKRCKAGGIEVAMVTGDHPLTARAIGRDIGLYENDDVIVTGPMMKEAASHGASELSELIRSSKIFARIEPTQKEQIVSSLMQDGHLVAVTGDGVNDAPAMRKSNVGIAMGKRGTDVAKETADLIITDDNFSSIIDGIEQGRVVYANIRKVIALLMATGFSALLLFLCSVIAGLQMPLSAVQLLWLNLIANGLQDVALAFEPKEGDELTRPPRKPNEPIFEKHIIQHVLVSGTTMGMLAFGVYYTLIINQSSIDEARNLTLMLMVLFGNIHALSSRSETRSIFSMNLVSNPILILAVPIAQCVHIAAMYLPGLSNVLGLRPITFLEWLALLSIAIVFLAIEEAHKFINRIKVRPK
jgi:calcium-translocating P-type ATPase